MPSQIPQWREPIAIVSMACRLPGGIDKPLDLWDHVRAGRSSATAIPKDRFNAENFLSMDPNQKGEQAFRGAHFVKRDIKQFDHKFFGISKDTATAMDPQQKQLLEVVYECLESANISMETISKSKIGCYCAMFVSDYHDMLMQDPDNCSNAVTISESIAEPLDIDCIGTLTTSISICTSIKCLTLPIRRNSSETRQRQCIIRTQEQIRCTNYCAVALTSLQCLAGKMKGHQGTRTGSINSDTA